MSQSGRKSETPKSNEQMVDWLNGLTSSYYQIRLLCFFLVIIMVIINNLEMNTNQYIFNNCHFQLNLQHINDINQMRKHTMCDADMKHRFREF